MDRGARQIDAAFLRGSHVFSLVGGRESRTYLARTRLIERGIFPLGPTQLHSGDIFGLFPASRSYPSENSLLVYPMLFGVRYFPGPAGLLPGGEALRRRTPQITSNASGVREYAPGDPLNRIHWLSTARRNRLIVKEFELDLWQRSGLSSMLSEQRTLRSRFRRTRPRSRISGARKPHTSCLHRPSSMPPAPPGRWRDTASSGRAPSAWSLRAIRCVCCRQTAMRGSSTKYWRPWQSSGRMEHAPARSHRSADALPSAGEYGRIDNPQRIARRSDVCRFPAQAGYAPGGSSH